MRVVLDTNVLVSGLLSPRGPPATIVGLVVAGTHQVCFDGHIMAEYREVLTRARFGFQRDDVDTVLSRLAATGIRVAPRPLPTTLPDPDDQPFLEVALAASADYLITGNGKHFPTSLCLGCDVVSPRDFIAATRRGE